MKHKVVSWIIFVCSLAALCISLRLFWNLGIYVDEHNTSPSAVCGGAFWNLMDWLRLLLLAVITVTSGIKAIRRA